MPVFVGVEEKDSSTKIFPARDYQVSSYLTFMANNYDFINFEYPNNIRFKIKKFDTTGFSGDYPRFCILENEKGEQHILSDDREKLSKFTGWKNRLMSQTFGGNSKKKTRRVRNKKLRSKTRSRV